MPEKFKHKEIENLIKEGKEKGTLSYEDIIETLESIEDLTSEEVDEMYETLIEEGVKFGDKKEIQLETQKEETKEEEKKQEEEIVESFPQMENKTINVPEGDIRISADNKFGGEKEVRKVEEQYVPVYEPESMEETILKEAGVLLGPPFERYTLYVTKDFCPVKEFEDDKFQSCLGMLKFRSCNMRARDHLGRRNRDDFKAV